MTLRKIAIAAAACLCLAAPAWAQIQGPVKSRLMLMSATNDATVIVPAGYAIGAIYIRNRTANAITGGIKIGTTSGATDVVVAQAVGANAFVVVVPLLSIFSATATQTLFIQDVTAWNSASVDIVIPLQRAIP